jgi:glucan biosynthesis protein C
MQTTEQPKARLFFLDNLRIYLTILVIFHHAALVYGGSGSWYLSRDPMTDEISPILLILFNAINQSYFMSAFFLLAGYFTPASLERKGTKLFLIDRVIRLAIPILIFSTLIINLNGYILNTLYKGQVFRLRIDYDPGHLWFLQGLLVFALVYIVYKTLCKVKTESVFQIYRETFPPDKALFISVAALTVLTFLVRLAFPVGQWTMGIQPAHFVHYTFCFYAGILAYRGDWFRRLSKGQARRWSIMSLVAILLFPVILVLGVGGNDANIAKFFGGMYWQAFVYIALETFLMVGIIIFLIYFFREKFNQTGPLAKSLAVNVYTIYIVHATILFSLQILLMPVNIPTILKFLISGLLAVLICYLVSMLIRKIPYAKRVLG